MVAGLRVEADADHVTEVDGVEVLRPKALRENYANWLKRILDKYGKQL